MSQAVRLARSGPDLLQRGIARARRRLDARVVDVREAGWDAPEAACRPRLGSALVDVELRRVRQYATSVPLVDVARNPYSRLAADLLAGTTGETTALHRFLAAWQPANSPQVYLGRDAVSAAANALPPTPDSLPWGAFRSPDDIVASVAAHDARLASRFGPARSGRHGFRSFGPTSTVATEAYVAEYRSLVASIVERGYLAGLDGHPRVQVLLGPDGSWAGRLLAGNHRLAVLAAQGVERTPCTVSRRIVRREEVDSWAGVRLGLHSRQEALEIFDHFLLGTAPVGYPTARDLGLGRTGD